MKDVKNELSDDVLDAVAGGIVMFTPEWIELQRPPSGWPCDNAGGFDQSKFPLAGGGCACCTVYREYRESACIMAACDRFQVKKPRR